MTRARNISNPTQITIPVTISSNITSTGVISVGNTTMNATVNSTSLVVGNSTVNSVIHSTGITANGEGIHSINASSIATGTLNTARLPATVNVSSTLNIGANVNLSTTSISIGNSTVNSAVNSSSVTTGLLTATANVSFPGTSQNTVAVTIGNNQNQYTELLIDTDTGVADIFRGGSAYTSYAGNAGLSIYNSNTSAGHIGLFPGEKTFPVLFASANGYAGVGNNSPYNVRWGANTDQISVGGSKLYGVLTLNGVSTQNTSYSIGSGDGRLYLAYDNIAQRHNITVAANGNVGIDNTNPAFRADIAGGLRSHYKITNSLYTGWGFGTGGWTTFFTLPTTYDYSLWAKIRGYNIENGGASHWSFYFTAVIRKNNTPFGNFYNFVATQDAGTQAASSSTFAQFRFTDLGVTNGTLHFQGYNTTYGNVLYVYEVDAYGFSNIVWA